MNEVNETNQRDEEMNDENENDDNDDDDIDWEQKLEQAAAAQSVRGQNMIEKILRNRIYENTYWKAECFGLTAATIVDKAVELTEVGGTFGSQRKPVPFIMLTLRMLQIQPEKEIILEFIKNEEFRYVRLLGAFYMRLMGQSVDVYRFLEPLYNDFRKIVVVSPEGKSISHVDEFIWGLLHNSFACDISLPHIPKRCMLEKIGVIQPRISALDESDLPQPPNPTQQSQKQQQQQQQQQQQSTTEQPQQPQQSTTEKTDEKVEEKKEQHHQHQHHERHSHSNSHHHHSSHSNHHR